MRIGTEIEISCAHKLELPYESKCQNLHGHNYLIKVELEGTLNKQGMVVDFAHLKRIIKEKYDHQVIRMGVNPTAENMVNNIIDYLRTQLKVDKVKVRVYETRNNWAEDER